MLEIANAEARLLMTADKDIGELVFRLGRAASGVLLVRLAELTSRGRVEVVSIVLSEHGDEMAQAFTVLSPELVRIRPPR